MTRCKTLVAVLGLTLSAVVAAEPVTIGGATGTTTTPPKNATPVIPTETLVVGGAAAVGTVAGLSSDSDGASTTSTSGTATAAP